LLGLFQNHLFIENRSAVQHEKIEGGNDGTDENNEFGAQGNLNREVSVHNLSVCVRKTEGCRSGTVSIYLDFLQARKFRSSSAPTIKEYALFGKSCGYRLPDK
jgi:hypothetical protein